jgi:hypothetical protein
MKVSDADSKVVDKMLEISESVFGKMSVVRGKKHTFLGINFELLDNER